MTKFDYAVYKALKILYKHIDVLRTKPDYKEISTSSALFLHYLRCLLEQHILYRMYLTPEQARSKELHYRNLWRCQKKSIEDIDVFITDLEKQRINHKKILENVVKRYKKNVATINKINKRCKEDITNTTNKYERKQLTLYKAWEFEQNEIKVALENIIDDFNSLKDINMKFKETIYERKSMIESKLLAVIAKYDTEIGNRYKILEELNEIYACDKLEKLALEKEMKQQEEIYLFFVKQRLAFKRERSVKAVQQWWRKIFWDRKLKEKNEKKIQF
ncbi:dynein regulatory complex protein 10-like isoform X2 [Linepithema humile]